jgi:hypothetical protein
MVAMRRDRFSVSFSTVEDTGEIDEMASFSSEDDMVSSFRVWTQQLGALGSFDALRSTDDRDPLRHIGL